jgi:hypothetical protein
VKFFIQNVLSSSAGAGPLLTKSEEVQQYSTKNPTGFEKKFADI